MKRRKVARRRRLSRKLERCVREVKSRAQRRPVNPYAVCRTSVGPVFANPLKFDVVLYAKAPDGTKLKYIGGTKFAKKGEPARFASEGHANAVKKQLREQFPILRKFQLWAK